MDEILDDIWSKKNAPRMHVKKLEKELIMNRIGELGRSIRQAEMELRSPNTIKKLKKEKEKYENIL